MKGRSRRAGIPEDIFGTALHPDDLPAIGAAVTHTLQNGGGFNIVYRLIQADGSSKWVCAVGKAAFDDGVAVRFPGTIIDLTDEET